VDGGMNRKKKIDVGTAFFKFILSILDVKIKVSKDTKYVRLKIGEVCLK